MKRQTTIRQEQQVRKIQHLKMDSLHLDNSVPIKQATTSRRVGLDINENFVVFDETTTGTFHGHIRGWNNSTNQGLDQYMKNALERAGYVKSSTAKKPKLTDEGKRYD